MPTTAKKPAARSVDLLTVAAAAAAERKKVALQEAASDLERSVNRLRKRAELSDVDVTDRDQLEQFVRRTLEGTPIEDLAAAARDGVVDFVVSEGGTAWTTGDGKSHRLTKKSGKKVDPGVALTVVKQLLGIRGHGTGHYNFLGTYDPETYDPEVGSLPLAGGISDWAHRGGAVDPTDDRNVRARFPGVAAYLTDKCPQLPPPPGDGDDDDDGDKKPRARNLKDGPMTENESDGEDDGGGEGDDDDDDGDDGTDRRGGRKKKAGTTNTAANTTATINGRATSRPRRRGGGGVTFDATPERRAIATGTPPNATTPSRRRPTTRSAAAAAGSRGTTPTTTAVTDTEARGAASAKKRKKPSAAVAKTAAAAATSSGNGTGAKKKQAGKKKSTPTAVSSSSASSGSSVAGATSTASRAKATEEDIASLLPPDEYDRKQKELQEQLAAETATREENEKEVDATLQRMREQQGALAEQVDTNTSDIQDLGQRVNALEDNVQEREEQLAGVVARLDNNEQQTDDALEIANGANAKADESFARSNQALGASGEAKEEAREAKEEAEDATEEARAIAQRQTTANALVDREVQRLRRQLEQQPQEGANANGAAGGAGVGNSNNGGASTAAGVGGTQNAANANAGIVGPGHTATGRGLPSQMIGMLLGGFLAFGFSRLVSLSTSVTFFLFGSFFFFGYVCGRWHPWYLLSVATDSCKATCQAICSVASKIAKFIAFALGFAFVAYGGMCISVEYMIGDNENDGDMTREEHQDGMSAVWGLLWLLSLILKYIFDSKDDDKKQKKE